MASKLVGQDRIYEAQEILAGFYHDVVHRCGRKPILLASYLTQNGYYQATYTSTLTYDLLEGMNAEKVEELSCLVAEDALKKLMIDDKYILPILLGIYSTIPFSDKSEPTNLQKRLLSVMASRKISLNFKEVNAAIIGAIAVTNRDHSAYGNDSLDEFNKKTWAMMLERNSLLANANHTIKDEATTIASFYNFHKQLYHYVKTKQVTIFHTLMPTKKIDKLNEHAVVILSQDIVLQDVQLGALVLILSIIAANDKTCLNLPITDACHHPFFENFLTPYKPLVIPQNTLSITVTEVLNNHGQT